MCGILVIYSKTSPLAKQVCDGLLLQLNHRGPDFWFSECFQSNRLYMGQTILSLTGSPDQNLSDYYRSKTTSHCLVFNGQIYNDQELFNRYLKHRGYINVTNTDSEVLVNLHEVMQAEDIHKKLLGMYAAIVFESDTRRLFITRDMVGEKVLYRYEGEDVLIFCSEIGPILNYVPTIKINKDVIREYFFTRHLLTPENTIFQGITVVQPGSLSVYELDKNRFVQRKSLRISSLVDPNRMDNNKSRSRNDLAEELDSLCQNSAKQITRRTNNAASIVSGGVDSSLASFYLQKNDAIQYFVALMFPGKDLVSENVSSFEPYLNQKIKSINVSIEKYSDMLRNAYQVACAPLSTHSFVSQAIIAESVSELGVNVLIGGEGADELYGGYDSYRELSIQDVDGVDNPSVYSSILETPVEFIGWSSGDIKRSYKKQWENYLKVFFE